MKKSIKRIFAFSLAAITSVSASVFAVGCSDGIRSVSVKNIVLMIGDGMGKNHLKVTADYYQEGLNIQTLCYAEGEVTTYSANSDVTDSAAAATALSCGVKTNNGMVAKNKDGRLMNMTEYMHSVGKRVGIVVTESVLGATPAGFSAHSSSRSNLYEIRNSELDVGADVMIGYDDSISMYETQITAAGYSFASNLDALKTISSSKAYLALDGYKAYGDENDYPTLGEAAEAAFDFLDRENPNGFFMMVEASHIDKYSHSNDIFDMMKQVKQFDIAVKQMVDKAVADGDTLVIVTADHETGNLQYNDGDEILHGLFKSTSHTGQNVKYFIYGKKGVRLKGVIDNTDICKLIRKCAK